MPTPHEIIANPRTGQRMRFLSQTRELLQLESWSTPHSPWEPEHVHPRQVSDVRVLSGALRFELGGTLRDVTAGQQLSIPAGTPHSFSNPFDEEAHWIGTFRPALQICAFFETYFALARDGRLDERGMPNLLQLAVLLPAFQDEIRPTTPPWPLLKALATVLGPVARWRGYRTALRDQASTEPDAEAALAAPNADPPGPAARRIVNPVQHDAVTFLATSAQTAGERTLARLEVAPGGKVTSHYHRSYSERFRILAGRLGVELDDRRLALEPGHDVTVPTGARHAWVNPGPDPAVAEVELRPGQPGWERMIRTVYGLAADGRVTRNGIPRNPLHLALALEWADMRLPGLAGRLQPALSALARVARRAGVDRALERRYAAAASR
jgi:mannose-6-phosphate isomerase-like protein (cupin superfamily)